MVETSSLDTSQKSRRAEYILIFILLLLAVAFICYFFFVSRTDVVSRTNLTSRTDVSAEEIAFCQGVASSSDRYSNPTVLCFSLLAAMYQNESLCDNEFSGSWESQGCHEFVSRSKQAGCGKGYVSTNFGECSAFVVVFLNDIYPISQDTCKIYSDRDVYDECIGAHYLWKASESESYLPCQTIKDGTAAKERCFSLIALSLRDISLCKYAQNEELISSCEDFFSRHMIGSNIGSSQQTGCLSVNVKPLECRYNTDNLVTVMGSRGTGVGNLTGLKLIFNYQSGTKSVVDVDAENFAEGTSRTFETSLSFVPYDVALAPVVDGNRVCEMYPTIIPCSLV